ncbi:MAG: glycosyltransferase family 2 protein [Candidatus Omnitrophica bacterium]|nr:glycosyltransferase family 2 protein [Candidatus Omnitrophota bacterium]
MISIIIPVYNESAAIESVIPDIIKIMSPTGLEYEIIAIDDKSTDDSLVKLKKIPGIRVISHEKNKGAGAVRNTGVIASQGEIIIMIDCDCTYPVAVIPELIQKMDGCDMVIGQRDKEVIWPIYSRFLIKRVLNKTVSLFLNQEIKDINSGLRIFRKKAIIPFLNFMPSSHSWVSTNTIIFAKKNYKTQYLAIDYYPRIGRSSFNLFFDGLRSLYCIIRALIFIKKEDAVLKSAEAG